MCRDTAEAARVGGFARHPVGRNQSLTIMHLPELPRSKAR